MDDIACVWGQNKKLAAPKQEKKEASKKGKRVKFDPANMKSVTQLQQVSEWGDRAVVEMGGFGSALVLGLFVCVVEMVVRVVLGEGGTD